MLVYIHHLFLSLGSIFTEITEVLDSFKLDLKAKLWMSTSC